MPAGARIPYRWAYLLIVPALAGSASSRTSQADPVRAALAGSPMPRPAPDQPWKGPSGEFLFVEAESSRAERVTWEVVATRPGNRYRQHGSMGSVLRSTGIAGKPAVEPLNVPRSANYYLWVRLGRHRKKSVGNGKLAIEILQKGERRLTTTIDADSESGVANAGLTDEDFRWFKVAAPLDHGPAEIRLSGAATTRGRVSRVTVDCLLLTTDPGYSPDYRDFNPQLYARFRVDRADGKQVVFQWPTTTRRAKRGPISGPVKPGAATPWLNFTRALVGVENEALYVQPKGVHASYVVEFATAPREAAIIAKTRVDSAAPVTFVVPMVSTRQTPPRADFELAAERAKMVSRLPTPQLGRKPDKFPLIANLRATELTEASEKHVLRHAGINGLTGLLTAKDVGLGFAFSRIYNVVYYHGAAGHPAPDVGRIDADLLRLSTRLSSSPFIDRIQHFKLIDEARAMGLDDLAKHGENHAAFRKWLHSNGYQALSPEERRSIGASGGKPEQLLRITPERETEFPGLYYFSQKFRAHVIAASLRTHTERVHQLLSPRVRTTQTMSDGAVLYGNMYTQGNDYFEYFKNGALDVATSEDWTDAGATRQLCGWNVALLRAATKYRRQPIHMYTVAHSTRKPVEVKLKALSNIAQGAKALVLYDYAPMYAGAYAGWAEDPPMIASISELAREIGAAEDLLMDAMPPAAQTAILYSIPHDIWTAGLDSTHGNERALTYLSLRHAHVPVDVLSDDDVIQGALGGYRALYAHGEQFPAALAARLERWVREGGTLVLGPGAGSRDEWNRPSTALNDALGLRRKPVNVWERKVAATRNLAKWNGKTLEVVLESSGHRVNALFLSQAIEAGPADRILARFADGAPAAVESRRGRGSVVSFGFLAATEYMRRAVKAFDESPDATAPTPRFLAQALARISPRSRSTRLPIVELWGRAPSAYDPALRQLLTAPALASHGALPVSADVPLVEATLLEGPRGWVVPLANYSGHVLAATTIRLKPSRPSDVIESAHHGRLPLRNLPDGAFEVTLPLDSTDFLYGHWR